MTREEWINRYAKRIQDGASWDEESAMDAAVVGAFEFERCERAAGNEVSWEAPEDAADEEMSYWGDDDEE